MIAQSQLLPPHGFKKFSLPRKKFVTKLIITEENERVTSVKMKTRESGASIYYPVLRYSTVKCMID